MNIQSTPVGEREGEQVERRVIGPDEPFVSVYDAMKNIAEEAGVPFRSVSIPNDLYRSRPTGKEGRFTAVIERRDVTRLVNRTRYEQVTA